MLCSIITVQPVFADGDVPCHISIVMTESPQDSVLIAWETNDTSVKQAIVQVVEAEDPDGFKSDKVMETTDGSVTVSGGIAYSKALVTGLKAGTEYIFMCGDGTSWSEVGTFKTSPETQEPFTFLYLSDPQINLSSGSQEASKTRQMFEDAWAQFGNDLSFTLITGDFTDYNDPKEWNELFDMAGNLFSNAAMVPVLGNHDRTFGTNYIRFKFPDPPTKNDDPTNGIEYTYAFEYGAALFMVIRVDSISNLQTIARWVEEQVNSSDKPWQIVAFHEAMYSAGDHIMEQAEARKVLSPVFDSLGIDLVLQGHDHTYSRSIVNGDGSKETPVSVDGSPNKVFDPDAPIYYQTISGATRFYSGTTYFPGSDDPLLPNYEFIDFKPEKTTEDRMYYTGITVSNEFITLTTYYTTTTTFNKGLLETYTIYNTNPAYIPKGSEWKYFDAGTEPESGWKSLDFIDSDWDTGLAPFGYPEGYEWPLFGAIKTRTDKNDKYLTTYFRKTFDVSDPSILADKGTIRLGIDDGVVLYLNGQEIGRYNVSGDGTVKNVDVPESVEGLPVLTLEGEDLSHIRQGTNVLAAEVHQWNESSSDLYWDMELTVETKAAPKTLQSVFLEADGNTVFIGGPGGGSTVQLKVSGKDDSDQDVDLTDATITYETDMPEVIDISPEGVVSVKNKAYDGITANVRATVSLGGITKTSDDVPLKVRIASERVLLKKNSEWSYLDDGSDQGTAWREREFNDNSWATGKAPLGYPATFDNPDFGTISKVVDYGSDPDEKHITTYFRKKINIENPDDYSRTGTVKIGVDDGVVLYLNGVEIARYDMPENTNYKTLANNPSQNSKTATLTLDNLSFVQGTNVFAAEVHQGSKTSSDLYWDMKLMVGAPAESVVLDTVTLSIDKNELVAGAQEDRNKAQLSLSGIDDSGQSIDLSQALVTYCTDRPDLISIDSDGVLTANYLPSLGPTAKIWAEVTFWNKTVRSNSIEVNIQFEEEVLLVDQGEKWLYFDKGDVKDDQWMTTDYIDSAWKEGSAPLGYGDFKTSDFGTVLTEVGYGSDKNNKYTTTYFRKKITIDNPSEFTGVGTIKVGYDDGVVIYLNGNEIARCNMPQGTVSYGTEASQRLENYKVESIPLDNLTFVRGENVIAAEVHQKGKDSSDLFWDMTLHARKTVKPEVIYSAILTAENNKYTMTYGGTAGSETTQLKVAGKDNSGKDLDMAGATVQYFTWWSDLINIDANGLVTFKKDPLVNTTVQIWAYVTLWGKTVVSNVININVIKLSQQMLIDRGMEWQYFDGGAVQGDEWKENKFDSSWSSGTAPLGFDEGDPPPDEWPEFGQIKTTVGYGGNSSNKNPTTYFRKTFNITDTMLIAGAGIGAGIIECGLDDGAVIYLNGQEIARYNMPEGTVGYETLTPINADEELEEPIRIRLDAEDLVWLKAGENLIAVEVHQCRAASTDLYWDMRLIVDTYCYVDIVPPEIKLKGDNPLQLKLNQKYNEPGAEATDIVDGNIEPEAIIIDSSNVDTSKPGTYTVTYRVADKTGNIGTATRVVIVGTEPIEDTTAPVITLLGEKTIYLTVGDTYEEPGAIAKDDVDGEFEVTDIDSSAVDVNTPGEYEVIYRAKDSAGNEATATRKVIVKEKSPPTGGGSSGGGSSGGGSGSGSGGSSGGGDTLIIPDETIPKSAALKGEITPTQSLNNQGVSVALISLDDVNRALNELGIQAGGIATIGINLEEVRNAKGYLLIMPAKAQKGDGRTQFNVNTPYGSIIIPNNVLDNSISDTAQVGIMVSHIARFELNPDLRSMVGNRPVIELSMWIDDKPYAWNNPVAPITIILDYEPIGEELRNPEYLVVVYIDGEGKTHAIPNGNYDPGTGKITFSVTHLSRFAVRYVYKTFADITDSRVRKKIEVMASKGIIGGTSATTYSPYANITRADFLYLLFRAMGIELKVESNFDDIKPGIYYYHAVGVARALNITSGTGNNRFSPDAFITRQDMMVMVAKALRVFEVLDKPANLNELDKLQDKADIVGYARDPVALLTGEGLVPADPIFRPKDNASREEVAEMIYNIYFYMRKDNGAKE